MRKQVMEIRTFLSFRDGNRPEESKRITDELQMPVVRPERAPSLGGKKCLEFTKPNLADLNR